MQEDLTTGRVPYKTSDGITVPSVTTVISRFKESGALVHWAWQQGIDGKDYRKTRDNAASIGTIAHAMMECHIKGREFKIDPAVPDDIMEKAMSAFKQFLAWSSVTKFTVTHSEIRLVSDKYGYGGTIDAPMITDKRSMGDWKTSRGLFTDYLIQVAAYGNLWNEHFPNDPITGGFHIIKFDKTYGGFTHKYWEKLDEAWEAFKYMLSLYKIDKILKEMIK